MNAAVRPASTPAVAACARAGRPRPPGVGARCAAPPSGLFATAAAQRKPAARQTAANFSLEQAWGTGVDAESLAPTLFAASLFPYLGFLYHLTKSKTAPPVALGGFYFLLVFVGVTIPAGIVAKTQYAASLANVDWLHGGAESMLTVTNLLIVIGLRRGIRKAKADADGTEEAS
ncbi:unnamed protein product [Pedinophyceae sp. YPF-701]|nr:unnamed protein product [Pedinophyceae sp. YPF-701]